MAIDINHASLKEADRIGVGATAEIYRFCDKHVIKKYNESVLNNNTRELRSFIEDLIKVRDNADESTREFVDCNFTWPIDIVLENGKFCGFIMNRIPEEYELHYYSNGKAKHNQLTYNFWLSGEHIIKKRGLALPNRSGRIVIAQRLLVGIRFLHYSNIVMGDISGKNMLIRFDPQNPRKNSLVFVDIDSYRGYRAEGLKNPIDTSDSPGWKSPDPDEKTSPQTDVYKICLAIARLYSLTKPCTMDPPNSKREYERFLQENYGEALDCISEEVGPLFSSAVKRGLSYDSINRPSADELLSILKSALAKNSENEISSPSSHISHIEDIEKKSSKKYMQIVNEDGTAEEVEVILAFKFKDNEKEYVIYTKNEEDDEGKITVYVSNIDRSSVGIPKMMGVQDEHEWERIQEVLRKLAETN